MRSWIFRNRLRLRAIYGVRPSPPPGAGAKDGSERRRLPVRAPATVERRGQHVVLRTRA